MKSNPNSVLKLSGDTAPMEDAVLYSVERLSVSFCQHKKPPFVAVRDVSFQIHENEAVGLVGESGSGKSVTALAMMGLLPRHTTEISDVTRLMYNGRNILTLKETERRDLRGSDWAMIFQEPMTSLNPVMTVGDQIDEVLLYKRRMGKSAARARTIELLEEVGLPEPQHAALRFPSQLSGGQQQRVMIAMALAAQPKLLIADEPTTALDVTVQKQIMDLLKNLKARYRMSILFISHDLALISQLADRVIVMRHGVIREEGSARRIFTEPKDQYTKALIQCRPALQGTPHRLPVIDDFIAQSAAARATKIRKKKSNAKPPVLLQVEGLSKSFVKREGLWRKHEVKAVDHVSFQLRRGKTLGLVGESGSGKTTVAMMLLRLLERDSGATRFYGSDIFDLPLKDFLPYRRRLQIVFQNPYASLNPRFTVGHSLLEPMLLHKIVGSEEEAMKQALGWLNRVGLDDAAFHKYPHEFSGGQRQRVALARALALHPELLVLDEPVSALDVSIQAQILNLLRDIQDELGVSYLFISHDLAVVRFLCDEVVVMKEGNVVESGKTEALFSHPKTEYTQKLLAAVPTINIGRRQES